MRAREFPFRRNRDDAERLSGMCAVALKRPRQINASRLPGAKRASKPGFIEPCDPTLKERAPSGQDWIYEIKIDGYRTQLHIENGRVTIYTRTGLNWTDQYVAIAAAAKNLRVKSAIMDGEAAVMGDNGVPDFQALRRELSNPDSARLQFFAFDVLYVEGYDLRGCKLQDRKAALRELLADAPQAFSFVDYLEEEDGHAVFCHACDMHLEGIVCKKRDAPYRSGRTESWIKVKCVKSATFPIVAFVEKLGAKPRKIASLYVGKREANKLLYAGKARSGYTESAARELREKLDPLIVRKSPLSVPVKKPKATWVQPRVLAEIAFNGVTDDGLLRAAVFKGLREDLRQPSRSLRSKPLRRLRSPSIAPEPEENSARGGVPRENILQLLPNAVPPSKDELRTFWKRIWKPALEHLGRRPLKLVRHTRGATFYHKGPLPEIPEGVHQLRLQKREGGEGVRVWVEDLKGLLGLVDLDAVELHPWNATVDDIEHADRLVFDLDPGEGVAWEFVTETAMLLRGMLQEEGFKSWPKVTGGKGLHLMAPLTRRMTHDAARTFCHRFASRLEADDPDRYTTSSLPARRSGRIYIDYLRNGRGNTAIGAYSPRARPGFPIAAPVTWAQVERGIKPDAFTMTRLPKGRRFGRCRSANGHR
jgi:bifunctional non-homologous end joining protein LigD